MKIKKIMFIPVLVFGLLLTSCANANTEEVSEAVNFDTTKELVEYISKDSTLKTAIKDLYPSEIVQTVGNNICIYQPKESPFGSVVSSIELNGDNIWYVYSIDGSSPNDQDTGAVNISSAEDYSNVVTFGWNLATKGSEGLNYFAKHNASGVIEYKDYPGVYYSDVKSDGKTVVGKMIYWVRDDYFFQAYIPLQYIDELLKQTNGMQDFAVPVIYSSTTFEAIK